MPAENPKFIDVKLFFEKLFNGKRKVMWSYLNQIEDSGFTYELLDDQILETSDFFTFNMPVLVKINDYHSLDPYCFRYVKNDSAFIRSSINNERVLETFTNIYTKVFHSHPTIGSMYHDYAENEVISYTIWEDSADGKINLLGLKNKNPILGVKKEQTLKGFSLSQNYPNPFNPITKIRYAVRTRRFVTLAVYDLLGRQVAALVNEEKLPGVYEVEFNANGLASGIYFYQLKAGSFVQTKKLILLK